MISRRKSSLPLLAIVVAMLCTALALAAAPQRRTVNKLSRPNEPVQSIAQIEVTVDQVIFEDEPDLMWIEGRRMNFIVPPGGPR